MSNSLREAAQQVLEKLAAYPLEDFGLQNAAASRPLYGVNGEWELTVGDVLMARSALAQPDDKVPVIKAEMYLALTDAMGYQEEREDGSNWSPEEWAAHLYESYSAKQDDKAKPPAERSRAWAADARDGMRYPEESDLTGGATDCHSHPPVHYCCDCGESCPQNGGLCRVCLGSRRTQPPDEQVMVDMTPPATARDRLDFAEQGRLAERDPRTHVAQGEELSDEQIDDYLNQPVPGGSIVRDWFSFPRGLQNVRNVVRIIVTADRAARGGAA